MKKFISLCMCLVLMISAFSLCALAAANADVNNDNNIDSSDARTILRAAVGLDKLTDAQKIAADIDMDGSVTASDARLALRVAVNLEKTDRKLYNNEFEVFKSGFFYVDMDIVEGSERHNVKMAMTDKSTYFQMNVGEIMDLASELGFSPSGNMTVSVLMNENNTYFVDEEKGVYAKMGDVLGESFTADEMVSSFSDLNVGSSGGLSGATTITTETFEGVKCTKYSFTSSDGSSSNVYMNGKKLVGMNSVSKTGQEQSRYVFNTVTLTVPASYTAPSASLKEIDAVVYAFWLMTGDNSLLAG